MTKERNDNNNQYTYIQYAWQWDRDKPKETNKKPPIIVSKRFIPSLQPSLYNAPSKRIKRS